MKWTVFDLYNKQQKEGTFSAATKKTVYQGYQGEVRARYLNRNNDKSYYINPADRISHLRNQKQNDRSAEPVKFYVRASQIRDAVLMDFELLESLINDKALFSRLIKEEQDRIKYYHYDYATLLIDDAVASGSHYDATNHFSATHKYQKIIDDYAKENALKAKEINAETVPEFVQEEPQSVPGKKQKKVKEMAFLSIEWGIFWFGFFNMYRLLITFLRYTWFYLATIARSLRWLEAIPFAVDADLLMAPTPIFNILSVMLFLGRLVFDFTMTLVHTFLPTEAEKDVNFVERFRMEWRKRYRRMVNDFAWSSFNAFTNFAWVFGIPIPVAGPLLVCFLAFDIYWFAHKWHQDELAIAEQKSLLNDLVSSLRPVEGRGQAGEEAVSVSYNALFAFDDASAGSVSSGSDTASADSATADDPEIQQQISFARLRLRQLECRREQTRGEYVFCIAAATLLVLSFALFLPFMASPLAAPLCFFGCAFAVAMYINCGNVGKAWRARHERNLSKNQEDGQSLDESEFGLTFGKDNAAKQAYQTARQDDYRAKCRTLAFRFTESLIVSAVLIALYTINWPAALALTLTYLIVKSVDFKQARNRFFPPAQERDGKPASVGQQQKCANDADGAEDKLLVNGGTESGSRVEARVV